MKLLDTRIALLMGTFGLLSVGCGAKSDATDDSGEPPADTDTDTDTDTDSDTDTDTGDSAIDTARYGFFFEGTGDATPSDYAGSEMQGFYSVTYERLICSMIWDATSTAPDTDCAECTFAFEMTYADMVIGEGEFCSNPGWDDVPGPREDADGNLFHQSWGWAPEYTDENGDVYADVLMFLFSDGAGGTTWAPFGGEGSATAEVTNDGYTWSFVSALYTTADMNYAAY
jgi:hypothetical protein